MSIKQNSKSSINCLKSFNSFPTDLISVSSNLLGSSYWSSKLSYSSSYLHLKGLWQSVSHLGAMYLLPRCWCESVCSQCRTSTSDNVNASSKNGSKSTSFYGKCILLWPLDIWSKLLFIIQVESYFVLRPLPENCTWCYEWLRPTYDWTTRDSNSFRKEIVVLLEA